MAIPSIASRAPDAPHRPENTSCCSILVKTAVTVAVVAAATIALSVSLASGSSMVGLAVLCGVLPIAGVFLLARWACTARNISYSRPRQDVSVCQPDLGFQFARSGLGPPAGAYFRGAHLGSGSRGLVNVGIGGPVLRVDPRRHSVFTGTHAVVGGGFRGVLPRGALATNSHAAHVRVGGGHFGGGR